MSSNPFATAMETGHPTARMHLRHRAAWLAVVWFMTWIATALSPALLVDGSAQAVSVTTAAVLAMTHNPESPDALCVDGTVFDAMAKTLETSEGTTPAAPCALAPLTLDADPLDATSGIRIIATIPVASALPLQGHMTRLRI